MYLFSRFIVVFVTVTMLRNSCSLLISSGSSFRPHRVKQCCSTALSNYYNCFNYNCYKNSKTFGYSYSVHRQYARKKDSDFQMPKIPADWVTVKLGSDETIERNAMSKRVMDAKRFDSKQFDDDDLAILNRSLGIEEELLEYQKNMKNDVKEKKKSTGKDRLKELTKLSEEERIEASKLKGFLEMNPFICSGCGTPFQSKAENSPGFLPKEKFQDHQEKAKKIRDKQDAIKILEFAGMEFDSIAAEQVLKDAGIAPDVIDAVQSLGSSTGIPTFINEDSPRDVVQELVEPTNVDASPYVNDLTDSRTIEKPNTESVLDEPICICQRCFRLQQYGKVEESLRPGWSQNELLTPERFESLLDDIKTTESVVLCIIDIFDIQGSVIKNLRQIAGDNPVVIAVNKVDLLPNDVPNSRILGWVHSEVKRICGFKGPRDTQQMGDGINQSWRKEDESGILRRSNVHLVSCQNGLGMNSLLDDLIKMANDNGNKVFVMGAANVGKSSFINRLLESKFKVGGKNNSKKSRSTPQATVSNLPGTTLDFLKIKLANGVTMVDTPGLILKDQLTSKLNINELKSVIPSKPINAATLRVQEGKCVLIGGLAKIELLEVSAKTCFTQL